MTDKVQSTILVADDEAINRKLLREMLHREGYAVREATNGSEALRAATEYPIDTIVLDLMMPEIDGIDVARQLKASAQTRSIPIVVVTALNDKQTRLRALEVGAEDFLIRPVDRLELVTRIRNLCRLKTYGDRLQGQNADLQELVDQKTRQAGESERFLRNTLDALSAHIAIVDQSMTIVAVNQAWRSFADRNGSTHPGYYVGSSYFSANELTQCEDEASMAEGVERVMCGDLPEFTFDYTCNEPEQKRWFVARATRFRDAGQSYAVIAHEDITELRLADLALRDAQSKLEESREQLVEAQKMEAIGRLAGGVAHDFNNLLTSMISFTRFVYDDLAAGDPRREDLAEVLRATESASQLTHQLLSFARRHPFEPRRIEVNESLTNIDRVLRRTLGETIELVLVRSTRPLHVMCDPGRFDQLIINLAVNARDAMPGGGTLTVEVGRMPQPGMRSGVHTERSDRAADHSMGPEPSSMGRDRAGAGEYARITVGDSGVGIAPQDLPHIFEPFFSTKGEQGTGLGLATCYGIVKQAGGDIRVRSEVGLGTRFEVMMPIATESADSADSAGLAPAGSIARTSRAEAPLLSLLARGQTALIVEDQPAILRTVSRILARVGFTVIEARTAEEALSLAEEIGTDLALLATDVVLPGLSGVELSQRLRKRLPRLRVLLTSGYMRDELTPSMRTDPAMAFLPKPFSPAELLSQVRQLLGSRASGSSF
ncbi:MAG: response regulator [Proteobacteria bacterium]|nr:response regulator [Pseudomonadota bacterium]